MQLYCPNVAEWIEFLLGVNTLGDPRNIVLDWSPLLEIGVLLIHAVLE